MEKEQTPVFILALEPLWISFNLIMLLEISLWFNFPEVLLIRINYTKSYISAEYFFQRSMSKLVMQETKTEVSSKSLFVVERVLLPFST